MSSWRTLPLRMVIKALTFTISRVEVAAGLRSQVGEAVGDLVGLGRMVLSYPELPHDVLTHGRLERKLVCRTFSDCTTAPRHGIVSGCYPLDAHYKKLPERQELVQIKQALD